MQISRASRRTKRN